MEKTISNTPQQNGVAEYMNRTLNERANSIRIYASLPKTFWVKTVNTVAYLINRGLSIPLGCKSPKEEWIGKAVSVSHLKVFSYVSYVHINAEKRDKLDAKSKKCFFIEYGINKFGYKFWDEQDKKIIRSKDVIFNKRTLYKNKNVLDVESVGKLIMGNEQVEFKEITKEDVAKKIHENPQNVIAQPQPSIHQLKRSTRISRLPDRYSPYLYYLLLINGGKPECYEKAMESEDSMKWELAMKEEMKSLKKNQT